MKHRLFDLSRRFSNRSCLYDLPKNQTFLISQKALITHGDKLLILKNSHDFGSNDQEWDLPGGLLETEETMVSGLKREVYEETRLKIKIKEILAVWDYQHDRFFFRNGTCKIARVIFLAYAASTKGTTVKLSEEHQEYRWVKPSELPNIRFSHSALPAIKRYLEKR